MELTGKNRREYHKLHYKLREKYGKAVRCDFNKSCSGVSNTYDWALKKGRNYSDNPKDYYQLCRSCHSKYDFSGERIISEETKHKMSLARIGVEPANKGYDSRVLRFCKTCGNEFKTHLNKNSFYCSLKCRKNRSEKIKCLDKKTEKLIKIYPSVREASKELGCLITSISNCLNGYSKSANGFKWKYYE